MNAGRNIERKTLIIGDQTPQSENNENKKPDSREKARIRRKKPDTREIMKERKNRSNTTTRVKGDRLLGY